MPDIVRSRFDHGQAMALAATEYQRVVSTLELLSPEDWDRPTECPGWTVRDMAGHMLGMAEYAASIGELVRQTVAASRRARRGRLSQLDAVTALQVQEHAGLDAAGLVERYRRVAPRAVRFRSRFAPLVASRVILGQEFEGTMERWTLAYTIDTILTRDPFMHRLDIARATGVLLPVTAGHEGVIVADVVAEWAVRHGRPFELDLSGPAGGHWDEGTGGERLAMDALDFCRVLSGRGAGTGLLAVKVPF
ncbi:maleylpyruvate isomerase family mycothiol-dependent enzyme [Citricoccus sp. SGAir0253]|uniref:maleylpyruvate isomerase family mycothiol-dependent enzyme n=1 Tax=Citricoccus sp. SGAir0253 TaxID=2567881 RepID=UPI00143E0745|nr:maleylpyruvate isomerase family mycothiol-dependent enzyme [Citricoccus sp. SGAir0253]